MAKKISQKEQILKHFKKRKTITSMEAFEKYRITRLSDIIFCLRKSGHDIETEMRYKDGNGYAVYHYQKGA